ncbi:unnamed protein product [Owenia fusiformis]|uniref:Uncharacterized protein n=1 Tax=Owenia fusiformis TaxID=6347 RepID=A0A8S4N5C5_OWEFU|nr:unnamed protein product [Owenia fusiformis]
MVYIMLSSVRSDSDKSNDNSHPTQHGLNMKEQRNKSLSQSSLDLKYVCGVDILSTRQYIQDFRLTCVYKGKTIDQCGSLLGSKDSYWEVSRDVSSDAKPYIQIDVSHLVNPLIDQITIQGNVKTVKILIIQDPNGKRRYSPIQGNGIYDTSRIILLDNPKPSAVFIKLVMMDLRNSNETAFKVNISIKCCIQKQAMAMFKCCVKHKVSTKCLPMCWGIQRFIDWPLCFYLYSHIQKSCSDGSPVETPWPWLLSGTEDSNHSMTTRSQTTSRGMTVLCHTGLTYAVYALYLIALWMY